jgi:hypothetical protein
MVHPEDISSIILGQDELARFHPQLIVLKSIIFSRKKVLKTLIFLDKNF